MSIFSSGPAAAARPEQATQFRAPITTVAVDRLDHLVDEQLTLGDKFLELRAHPPTKPITWIGGTQLPPSAVACHLLEELLVHGYDISRAAGTRWQIEPAHAALAILGGAVPIVSASPQSWVRPDRAAGVQVRAEFRLRRHGAFALAVDNGTLSVEAPPAPSRAGVSISADPAEWLLLMLGRRTPWHAMCTGKAVAWGRRPQALLTLLHAVSPP
jgi:hypothetical protein